MPIKNLPPDHQDLSKEYDFEPRLEAGEPVARPEALNMGTLHATHYRETGTYHTVGCIAGITAAL